MLKSCLKDKDKTNSLRALELMSRCLGMQTIKQEVKQVISEERRKTLDDLLDTIAS